MLRAFAEASCKLSIVDEMRVVRSEAHGKWSADDARQNLADIKNLAATFGERSGLLWVFNRHGTGRPRGFQGILQLP